MKRFRQYIIPWMAAAAILTGCSQDELPAASDGVPFSLTVRTGLLSDSRAVIDTDYLPNSAQLGVQLVKAGARDLYLSSTGNMLFTHSSAAFGSWSASSTVYLNAAEATAYAYYPYSSSVTDFNSVPVVSGTTDYLYGQSIGNVNDGSPQAIIYMHHALAAVRLSCKLGTASAMSVSSVTLNGQGYHASGSMNVYTGAVTGAGAATPLTVSYDTPLALSSTAQNIDFVLVPTGTSAPLTLTVTDGNGVAQTITTEAVQLAAGTLHTIQLTADYGGTLSFGSVTAGDWGYSDDGKPVISVGGYTVTCAGDTDGIAFSNTVDDDGTVTIIAVPVASGATVNEVTCSSGATCTQFVGYNGARTIVLSGITSDVTVTFTGAAVPTIDPATAANGVYVVNADGDMIDAAAADESCIGVALVAQQSFSRGAAGHGGINQIFIIEKNGEANINSIMAAYTADGATDTGYTYFYWGSRITDTSITNYSKADGTNNYGFLNADRTPTLSLDFNTWTSGMLSDFNGKSNTAILAATADTDTYTELANAATYCTKFNETASENHGFTDWYIPACGQLALMWLYKAEINAALEAMGGTILNNDSYWSSTETSSQSGVFVSLSNGRIDYSDKNNMNPVRFIRDIE